MPGNSHCRHRFPPVEFADRLEAWGAASLFGGFKPLPLDFASAIAGALARGIGPCPAYAVDFSCAARRLVIVVPDTGLAAEAIVSFRVGRSKALSLRQRKSPMLENLAIGRVIRLIETRYTAHRERINADARII
jgi:hypothetical protein